MSRVLLLCHHHVRPLPPTPVVPDRAQHRAPDPRRPPACDARRRPPRRERVHPRVACRSTHRTSAATGCTLPAGASRCSPRAAAAAARRPLPPVQPPRRPTKPAAHGRGPVSHLLSAHRGCGLRLKGSQRASRLPVDRVCPRRQAARDATWRRWSRPERDWSAREESFGILQKPHLPTVAFARHPILYRWSTDETLRDARIARIRPQPFHKHTLTQAEYRWMPRPA